MKRFLTIISILILLFAASGCENAEKALDTDGLTTAVLEQVAFENELTEINDTVLSVTYSLPEGAVGKAYHGSSASADRFAIFTAKSTEDTNAIKQMLEKTVTSLHNTFAAYDVPELTKIDNAVIRTHGCNVIFCITDDYENAAKIIDSRLG